MRIDHPHGLDTHGEVIFNALLDVAHAVFAGEDFDAEQGRRDDDGLHRRGAADDAYIGDAVVGGGGLHALLGEYAYIPVERFHLEEKREEDLYAGVGLLAHGVLLGFAVDPITVGAVGGVEVFFARNVDGGGRGHGDTSLKTMLIQRYRLN